MTSWRGYGRLATGMATLLDRNHKAPGRQRGEIAAARSIDMLTELHSIREEHTQALQEMDELNTAMALDQRTAREIEASGEPLMVRGFALPLPAPDMRSPFLKRRLPRRPPPLEEIIPLERRAKAQMPQARRWRKPIGVLEIIVRGESHRPASGSQEKPPVPGAIGHADSRAAVSGRDRQALLASARRLEGGPSVDGFEQGRGGTEIVKMYGIGPM